MTRNLRRWAALLVLWAWSAAGAAAAVPPFHLQADTIVVNSAAGIIDARGHVRLSDGRVVVVASRAVYSVRTRRIDLSGGISATSPDASLRSREAVILLGPKNSIETLDAQGAVAVRSQTRTLLADRLVYTIPTANASATGNVRISAPGGVATGERLFTDLKRKTSTLTAARLITKDGTVTSDRLDIDESARRAVFRGHVNAGFQETKATAETATLYEREKKVIFRGGVRIDRGGRVLLADTVTFYYADNRLVAEGKTRIIVPQTP